MNKIIKKALEVKFMIVFLILFALIQFKVLIVQKERLTETLNAISQMNESRRKCD
jgi:hypothetical protein